MAEYLPYQGTKVPVHKSQEEIKRYLRDMGAKGVQFTESFEENRVSMRWLQTVHYEERETDVVIRFNVPMFSEINGNKVSPPQIWRALMHWIKSFREARLFGFTTIEDSFLGFIEILTPEGRNVQVRDVVLPKLASQQPVDLEALPRQSGTEKDRA